MWRPVRQLRLWLGGWFDGPPRLHPVDERRVALGRALRRARMWRDLTQDELAALVAVAPRTVGRWESGDAVPSILELGPLCLALRVPADYFRRAPDENVDRLLLE